jgi:hypothetical protein
MRCGIVVLMMGSSACHGFTTSTPSSFPQNKVMGSHQRRRPDSPASVIFRLYAIPPEQMRISELKQELESYGIPSRQFFEKRELVQAVAHARMNGGHQPPQYDQSPSYNHQQQPPPQNHNHNSQDRDAFYRQCLEECSQMPAAQLEAELMQQWGVSPFDIQNRGESLIIAVAKKRVEAHFGPEPPAHPQPNNNNRSNPYIQNTAVKKESNTDDDFVAVEAELIEEDWRGPRQSAAFENPNYDNPYRTVDPTVYSDPRQYYKESGSSAYSNPGSASSLGGIGDILKNMQGGGNPDPRRRRQQPPGRRPAAAANSPNGNNIPWPL